MPAKPANFAGHGVTEFVKMFSHNLSINTTQGITAIYKDCIVYNCFVQQDAFSSSQEMVQ